MKRSEQIARRNGRRISKLLAEVVDACNAEGFPRVKLFFEPEGAAIFVMNVDHPHEDNERSTMGQRQEAIVARVPVIVTGVPFGAGAW